MHLWVVFSFIFVFKAFLQNGSPDKDIGIAGEVSMEETAVAADTTPSSI